MTNHHGTDILEGFAKDAEMLGKFVGESPKFDNKFYRLCIQDNAFIFTFKPESRKNIPLMELADLEKNHPLGYFLLLQNGQDLSAASLLLLTYFLCFFGTYSLNLSWNPFLLTRTGLYPEVLSPVDDCDISYSDIHHWDSPCMDFLAWGCCRIYTPYLS